MTKIFIECIGEGQCQERDCEKGDSGAERPMREGMEEGQHTAGLWP